MRLVVILTVFACTLTSCEEQTHLPGHVTPPSATCQVFTYTLPQNNSAPILTSFGTIIFKQKTDISSRTEGRIKKIYIQEGDRVQKGDLLVLLENLQLRIRKEQVLSALTSAEAALALTEARCQEGKYQVEGRLYTLEKLSLQADLKKRELEAFDQVRANKRELLAADGISQEEMQEVELQFLSLKTNYLSILKDVDIAAIGLRDRDILASGLDIPENPTKKKELLISLNTRTLQAEAGAAQAQVETSRAELSSMELLLSALSVTAEIGGVIGAVYYQEEENIDAGSNLLTIFQPSPMHIQFSLPEEEGEHLYQGQALEAVIPALGNVSMDGVIDIISPTIDPQSGTVTVKALVDNRDNQLKPGMFASVHITMDSRDGAITIPIETLTEENRKRNKVFVVKNGKAFIREVEIGGKREDKVEIIHGLKPGDTLILSPPGCVTEGKDVRISEK